MQKRQRLLFHRLIRLWLQNSDSVLKQLKPRTSHFASWNDTIVSYVLLMPFPPCFINNLHVPPTCIINALKVQPVFYTSAENS